MVEIKTRSEMRSDIDSQIAPVVDASELRDVLKSKVDSQAVLAEIELRVINMSTTAPPGGASDRDQYVVGSGATGAWSGKDGQIAIWDADQTPSAGWFYIVPTDGQKVENLADDTVYRWDADASPAAWVAQSGSTLSGLTDTTISSPADGEVLTYDNATSKWVNSTASSSTFSTSTATLSGSETTVAIPTGCEEFWVFVDDLTFTGTDFPMMRIADRSGSPNVDTAFDCIRDNGGSTITHTNSAGAAIAPVNTSGRTYSIWAHVLGAGKNVKTFVQSTMSDAANGTKRRVEGLADTARVEDTIALNFAGGSGSYTGGAVTVVFRA